MDTKITEREKLEKKIYELLESADAWNRKSCEWAEDESVEYHRRWQMVHKCTGRSLGIRDAVRAICPHEDTDRITSPDGCESLVRCELCGEVF